MADLEIKFNYTASKVEHVPFWYSETLPRTVLIFWMQNSSHLLKIMSNRMTLICGDSNQGDSIIWMQSGTYTTPSVLNLAIWLIKN